MYQLKSLQNFPNNSFSSEVDIHSISRLSNQISNRALNANRGQKFSKKSRNQFVAAIELVSYTQKNNQINFLLDLIWR